MRSDVGCRSLRLRFFAPCLGVAHLDSSVGMRVVRIDREHLLIRREGFFATALVVVRICQRIQLNYLGLFLEGQPLVLHWRLHCGGDGWCNFDGSIELGLMW